ncbi:hypothetical protein [Pseudomonas sp.]|uniref:hypothetical protein n=1 Tax=Pseudomonas sp. TaxID=306 RepID=UPI003BB6E4C8
MAVDSNQYFNGLRSYLSDKYQVIKRDNGRIILEEKIFLPGEEKPKTYTVRLGFEGDVIVVRLDRKNQQGNSDPLFHFLDDESKPWAKKCDFVVFNLIKGRICIYCLEFKSASLPDSLADQLNSSAAWCRAMHSVIKLYTNKSKQMTLKKFVFSSMNDPSRFLDSKKYIKRDHTIRHYHYDELTGLSLEDLQNENPDIIR